MVKYHFQNERIVHSNLDYIIHKGERERSLVVLANRLFSETYPGRYRGDSSTRMILKLSRLLEYTLGKDRYRDVTIHLDNKLDEVLSVRFSHRDDIKLSLYFDEQENEDAEDVEEAALFHMHNGELSMFSGTLADILVELDSFL